MLRSLFVRVQLHKCLLDALDQILANGDERAAMAFSSTIALSVLCLGASFVLTNGCFACFCVFS